MDKGNLDGYNKDLENCPIKEEDPELNEFKCDGCFLEFTTKEYLENHYSQCHNKDGGFIQEIKEDKDLENCLHKEEDLEWSEFKCDVCLLEFTNIEHLENHYSECVDKEEEFTQELKDDNDLENYLPEEENSEANEEYLENRCSESPNKHGGSILGLNKDEAGLSCSFCKEDDFQKESYERHVKRFHVENSYSQLNKINDFCITGTKRDPAQVGGKERNDKRTVCNYSAHVEGCIVKLMRIHNNETSFKCDMFDYMAKESETSHFSSKHYDEREKYDSRVCALSTPSEDAFGSHRQINTSEKLFECDYVDAQKIHKMHAKSKHSSVDKEYKCRDCEYSTHKKSNLVNHVRVHTNEKPFKCDMCDYSAALKMSLKDHILVKHSNTNKEYKCKDCEYSTYRKGDLVKHIYTHTNEKPFKCDKCDHATARKGDLNAHILAKHSNAEKEYKCKVCKYSTHRKAHLVKHVRTHTNEKPFKCGMCDYATAQKETLNAHVLAKHSNAEKGYKCKNCEYSTYRKGDLVKHIRTHTNEKPLKCDRCDYATAQKERLNIHVLEIHSNADEEYKYRDYEYFAHESKANKPHMHSHQ